MSTGIIRNYHGYPVLSLLGSFVGLRVLHQSRFIPEDVSQAVFMCEGVFGLFAAVPVIDWHVS